MKTITLKLTDTEYNTISICGTSSIARGFKWIKTRMEDKSHMIEIENVDKFREFLNDEMIKLKDSVFVLYPCQASEKEYQNLKSILSKLDKAVVLNNLQKQITKVEEIDKDFCDMVAEGCNADEGDGQFYNGVRIDEDTILVLSTWYDRTSNSEDYFHYSISKDKLVSVDAEMDEKYRDLFEDCNMLDYTDCFYIMGVSPIGNYMPKDNKAVIDYGDEYNDTIVNLDGVQNDEPKGNIGVWDITFYREDDEGNQTLYEYNGDCSIFSDMVDEDDLTKVQNDEPKCCDDDDNLEWVEEGECFPYEVWKCSKCEKMYNVEMVRDFKNKEIR